MQNIQIIVICIIALIIFVIILKLRRESYNGDRIVYKSYPDFRRWWKPYGKKLRERGLRERITHPWVWYY